MFKRKGLILVLGIVPLIWASQGYSYDETDPAIAKYLRDKEKESAQTQEASSVSKVQNDQPVVIQPQAAPQAQPRPSPQQPEIIIIPPSTSQSGPQPLLKTAPQAPPPRVDQSSDYVYTPDAPAIPKIPGAAVPAPVRNNVEQTPQQNQQSNWWQQAPQKAPTKTQSQFQQTTPVASVPVQQATSSQPIAPSQQSRSFFQFVPNNSGQGGQGQQGAVRRSIYQ
ncbi:MAG: hypothetical protein WCW01_03380 [Gammaproteobacteria bacterium]